MLSELVVCAVNHPPAEGGSSSAEAIISIHDLHSYSSITTFKKSSCLANCLAVSPTHVFAAQSDKATLNVYNRIKNNQEATIPLSEKATAIACSKSGGLVAIGTESGRLNVWETASGRYTSTNLAHLQRITVVTFDATGNFILTGSADSNVMVWSVPHLLDPNSDKKPTQTLEHHQAEITSIVCGKGSGPANFAITASKDSSVLVWNPFNGTVLRTFIFSLAPLSLAMDTADRAFYVGFEDGTIQQVEFAKIGQDVNIQFTNATEATQVAYANPLFTQEGRSVPVTVSTGRWQADNHDSGVITMSVMFEGNYLVAGNAKGAITIWDVATGYLFKTLTQYKSSISCLKILYPTGFHKSTKEIPTCTQPTLVPPRYHNIVQASSNATDTTLPPLSLTFVGVIESKSPKPDPFGYSADLEAVERGLELFRSITTTSTVTSLPSNNTSKRVDNNHNTNDDDSNSNSETDKKKIIELEQEVKQMHDNYQRLSAIHKQTWEEHAKWRLEMESGKKMSTTTGPAGV